MTRLYEFLISLAIVAILFVVVGLVLPSSREVSHSVETNRRMTIVYDVVNSFTKFHEWNAITARDPSVQLKLSGPQSGKGARVDYVSKEKGIGTGHWIITDSVERERVDFAIQNEQWGTNKRSRITLTPTGRNNRNVKIEQSYNVDYGWNLIGRYAGLYVSSFTGEDIKIGLSRLSAMLSGIPNQDYAQTGGKLVGLEFATLPATHALVVDSGGVPRSDNDIYTAILNAQEWIKRASEANNLEAVGPVRIITRETTREMYRFDVVQPVRKKGSEAPASEALSLNLPSQVKYELVPESQVARGKYTGYFQGLESMRAAVRAWALVNGKDVVGTPFEDYSNGAAKAFNEDGEFIVYWQTK